ncbi:acetylglutamate kinase [bacterium]|nr:acetylglutamate kinase [bacterium]
MDRDSLIKRAQSLTEALPYIREFSGKTLVIKFGGSAMIEENLKDSFALDVVLLKYVGMNPVIVHGGGPEISLWLERLGKKSRFVNGLRVTDPESMKIIEMVLVGLINKEIVNLLNQHGGQAVGLSGKDGKLIIARKISPQGSDDKGERIDLGMVGEVESVNPRIVEVLDEGRFIPVISPVAVSSKGETFNVNADMVADHIACALKAEKLIVMTDVAGVLDGNSELIPTLSGEKARELFSSGPIKGGMMPKLSSCLHALENGVKKVHIIDGRISHSLLLEIFTDTGVGTVIL